VGSAADLSSSRPRQQPRPTDMSNRLERNRHLPTSNGPLGPPPRPGSLTVLEANFYTIFSMGVIEQGTAASASQRPPRFRFQARLSAGVRRLRLGLPVLILSTECCSIRPHNRGTSPFFDHRHTHPIPAIVPYIIRGHLSNRTWFDFALKTDEGRSHGQHRRCHAIHHGRSAN
jgi:hypothetical protein